MQVDAVKNFYIDDPRCLTIAAGFVLPNSQAPRPERGRSCPDRAFEVQILLFLQPARRIPGRLISWLF